MFAQSGTIASAAPRTAGAGKDTIAPVVGISAPAAGASVSGTIAVAGTASDNAVLKRVQVRVDAGAWQVATGTTSWSLSLDTTTIVDGSHVITAAAIDRAGNTATTSVSVSVSNVLRPPPPSPSPSPTSSPAPSLSPTPEPTSNPGSDLAITNPSVSGTLVPVGLGPLPERDGVTAVLYVSPWAGQLWARFVVQTSGAYADVRLPASSISAFGNASYALSGNDLWILSGDGPLTLHRYALTGSPLPSSASFVSSQTVGNDESAAGAMLTLADGSVVATWHQQTLSGPQGNTLMIRRPGAEWQTTSIAFMMTRGSTEALAQHPVDGSLWLFVSADGFSSIGAARFTVGAGGLAAVWSDPYFIDSRYGDFGADPERPDVTAAADAATGTIALAYQTGVRKRFSDTVTGSLPAIARIPASGPLTFVGLPTYVERVSTMSLAARGGDLWLGYRPIEEPQMTFDRLNWSRYSAGRWTTTSVGTLYQPHELLLSTPTYPVVAMRLADGMIHVVRG